MESSDSKKKIILKKIMEVHSDWKTGKQSAYQKYSESLSL